MTEAIYKHPNNLFSLHLLPSGAAFCNHSKRLFVADLHLGKETSFKSQGIFVSQGPTEETLARLSNDLTQTQAKEIWVLGDLIHDKHSVDTKLLNQIENLKLKHNRVSFNLVQGNHDSNAGLAHNKKHAKQPRELTQLLGLIDSIVDEGHSLEPHTLFHHPPTKQAELPDSKVYQYGLSGHVHPAIALQNKSSFNLRSNNSSLTLPCFAFGPRFAILPSYGFFTGSHTIASFNASCTNPIQVKSEYTRSKYEFWTFHVLTENEIIELPRNIDSAVSMQM